MALAANALCTLTEVKTELSITVATHDAYLESLINYASTAIENFLNRKLGKVTDKVEKVPGYGGCRIRLSLTPVLSFSEVSIVEPYLPATPVDISDVTLEDSGAGFLYYRSGWPWTVPLEAGSIVPNPLVGQEQKAIEVKYTGGYILPNDAGPTLPADIERACILIVAYEYNRRGQTRGVKSESLMSYSVTFENAVGSTATQAKLFPSSPFPSEAMMILLPYRRVNGA